MNVEMYLRGYPVPCMVERTGGRKSWEYKDIFMKRDIQPSRGIISYERYTEQENVQKRASQRNPL